MVCYSAMIKRIGIGLGGAAIGAVLGWTVAIFLRWRPAVAIFALLFGLIAVWAEEDRP